MFIICLLFIIIVILLVLCNDNFIRIIIISSLLGISLYAYNAGFLTFDNMEIFPVSNTEYTKFINNIPSTLKFPVKTSVPYTTAAAPDKLKVPYASQIQIEGSDGFKEPDGFENMNQIYKLEEVSPEENTFTLSKELDTFNSDDYYSEHKKEKNIIKDWNYEPPVMPNLLTFGTSAISPAYMDKTNNITYQTYDTRPKEKTTSTDFTNKKDLFDATPVVYGDELFYKLGKNEQMQSESNLYNQSRINKNVSLEMKKNMFYEEFDQNNNRDWWDKDDNLDNTLNSYMINKINEG